VKLGHRPTMAASGEAAIESWLAARAAGTPYDRVLTDLHMPGMDDFLVKPLDRERFAAALAA
jgi:CheY-like chemotaxis protein